MDKPHTSHRLSTADATALKTTINNFLLVVESLRKYYEARGGEYFNFTINCHYLAHIGEYAAYLTPRASWCYGGESFMSTIKMIVASCVHGSGPAKACAKASGKFVEVMSFATFGFALWR